VQSLAVSHFQQSLAPPVHVEAHVADAKQVPMLEQHIPPSVHGLHGSSGASVCEHASPASLVPASLPVSADD
jgi:hypothetical protein